MSSRAGPMLDEDYADIQGLVRFGYKHLRAARFHLLTITDPLAARSWLRNNPATAATKGTPPDVALHVAFTFEGLERLGAHPAALAQFPYEFVSGITEPSRARRLGDIAANNATMWAWGGAGQAPHVLVMLYAVSSDALDRWETTLFDESFRRGFTTIAALPTSDLDDTEPFGFIDGISQPELDWGRTMSERIHDTISYTNLSSLGEVLLGYPNEYGKYTDRPLLDPGDDPDQLLKPAEDAPEKRDFGRNGTYLVFRDLSQDVDAFSRSVIEPGLADAAVGRRRDGRSAGEPLVPLSDASIPGVHADPTDAARNRFTYEADRDGTACPFGAHIRRANPRNTDLPEGTRGLWARLIRILGFGRRHPHEDLIASTRFHRILRRGREYAIGTTDTNGVRTTRHGLRFICLNANISRQFEFVQASWLANPKFEGLDEGDPLIAHGGAFTQPQPGGVCRRTTGLPQVVRVRGGAYFFMPGLSAVRFLVR